jgi:hypothetical protein
MNSFSQNSTLNDSQASRTKLQVSQESQVSQEPQDKVVARKRKAPPRAVVFTKEYVKQNSQGAYYCTHCNHTFNNYNLKNGTNPLNRHVEECRNIKLNIPSNVTSLYTLNYQDQCIQDVKFIDGFKTNYRTPDGKQVHKQILDQMKLAKHAVV